MAFLIGTDPGLRQTRTPSTDNFTHGVGFTANSSTTIVLSQDPGNENHLDINFDGIEQHRNTYTVSGTTVTFDAVIPTGVVNIQATYAVTVASLTVPDSSVSTAKIVDASVTTSKILDANITTSKILDANVTTSKILDANITTSKIQDNAVSLDKMAHGLDGNLITFDANGAPSFVSTGSSAQVLTSAGAGAPPVFADAAAGGAWTLIGTQVANNSASLIQTGLITYDASSNPIATYATVAIILADFVGASSNARLKMRAGDAANSGQIYTTEDYNYIQERTHSGNGTRAVDVGRSQTAWFCANEIHNDSTMPLAATYFMTGLGSSVKVAMHGQSTSQTSGSLALGGTFMGTFKTSRVIDRIQVFMGSGNIKSGRMTVWGIAHA